MNTTNNLIKRVSMTLCTCILLCIGILFSAKQAFAWDGTVLEAEVSSPTSGSVLLGLKGSYATQAQAALERINEIRYEACTEGDVPDPRDSSRMLTEADYVPLVWNTNLESIARIRAAESFLTVGHRRLNGQSIWSVTYNGEKSWSEDLAWNSYATKSNSMILGINQWYGEKSDWLTYKESSPRQTGHYTSMINPNYVSVGLGCFFSQGKTLTNCVAGELSYYAPTNQQMLPAYDDILQKLQVASSAVTYYLGNESESITSMEAGTSTTVAPYALYNGSTLFYVIGEISYTSSDSSVATIDSSGNVSAISNGSTSLTAYLNGTALVTTDLLVQCDHSLALDAVIQESTCVQEGTASYICRKCGASFTQAMPLAAHDYQVTSTSSDGKSTVVCSVCGNQATAQIPTSMSIFMKNDTSTSGYYYSYAPENNPINSNILLFAWDIDGDSGYDIANVTVSDPSILSPEKTTVAYDEEIKLRVKSTGIVTLTVSAVYNPSLSQSWTIRVGDQGGADLSEATVSLSTTSYTYTGSAKQPSVKVSWRGYSLTSGTDYTVSYENNVNVGTAKVVVTGAGIFGGKIEKEFQITCSSHKEQTVSGQAATCTKAGYTSSKKCSVCGKILTEPTVIKALGHSYNSGVVTKEPTWETTGTKVYTCTRCGNKKTETVPVLKTIHIKTQPVSVEAGLGQTVTLSLKALNAVSYQWYYSKDGKTWYKSGVTGNTSDTLSFKLSESNAGRYYKCKVTDKDGNSEISDTVTANLVPPVKIITQPVNQTKYLGDTITLKVKAENAVSYQWYYSKDGKTWYKSGATGNTTNTLSFVLSSSNAGRFYKCKMLDRIGIATYTNTVTVKEDQSLKITTQPTTVTAVIGETVTFKVDAKNASSYQWLYSKDGKTWYKSGLTGATTKTLTFKLSESNTGRSYKCKVIGISGDSAFTNTVTVNLDTSMKILSQPMNASGKVGDTVNFKVTAANVATYQWLYSKDGKAWYKSSSTGYNTDTLTIKITSTTEGRYYKCKLTDSDGKSILTDVVH